MIAFTRTHIAWLLPTCDEIGLRRRLHDLILTKLSLSGNTEANKFKLRFDIKHTIFVPLDLSIH